MTTTTDVLIPAGTYNIDASHSEVSFVVRHLVVTKVRGSFAKFSGAIVVASDLTQSTVDVTIDASSVSTRDEGRDTHIKSPDFFNVEANPTWSFKSTSVAVLGKSELVVTGDLTMAGITKSTDLKVALNGVAQDPWGNSKAAFTASTKVNRIDFGMKWNAALETGGVLVSENVDINLEIQAALQVSA
jgi:polyisoprenoid-binding protein YceI